MAQREHNENKGGCVSVLIATAARAGRVMTEEEAIAEIKEKAGYNIRKQLKKDTICPRKVKDIFLEGCKIFYYLYSGGDEFTSPRLLMEDVKSYIFTCNN